MAEPSVALKGIVRGRTIELDRDVGLPEGQAVAVTVQPVTTAPMPAGVLSAFGAWSDDPEGVEQFVRETHAARESEQRDGPKP